MSSAMERGPSSRAQAIQRGRDARARAHAPHANADVFDGHVEKPARVSSTCLVAVARNRYSMPCELAGQMVSARLYPTEVVVVAGDAIVARHERVNSEGQTRY